MTEEGVTMTVVVIVVVTVLVDIATTTGDMVGTVETVGTTTVAAVMTTGGTKAARRDEVEYLGGLKWHLSRLLYVSVANFTFRVYVS
jgi:hypothetical protein